MNTNDRAIEKLLRENRELRRKLKDSEAVIEAARHTVTQATAHFRCPLCTKTGRGHTMTCPIYAQSLALAAYDRALSE